LNQQGSVNVLLDVQGWIAAPVLTVTPPLASALNGSSPSSTDGQQAQAILDNANKYAMTTWWNSVYPSLAAAPMKSQSVPDSPSAIGITPAAASAVNTSDNTRRMCMEAYSLAVSLTTGAYNPAASGNVSAATATSRTVTIINKVVGAHLVNMPGGWGATTESTFYAAYIGTAAWLLWPDLTPAVQAQVAKMVYFEAEWGTDYQLFFYANAAGTVISPGNTGSDGDSWTPMAAQLAVQMMPTNAHVPMWQYAIVRDSINSWTEPKDTTNTTIVNGATVAQWDNNAGSNELSNGVTINHNRIAPDYSTLIYQNMEDILVASLAGNSAPQAITTLVGQVYSSYTQASLTGSSYAAPPAGDTTNTVYPPLSANSSAIYYPQGTDWGAGEYIPFALNDAQTATFGAVDATADNNAAYQNLHASKELALQSLNSDGSTYNSSTSPTYVYAGREEHVAQLAAMLYLTMYIRDNSLNQPLNSTDYTLAP
jgi:hypothetical protein